VVDRDYVFVIDMFALKVLEIDTVAGSLTEKPA
jgi:hypothetical protein